MVYVPDDEVELLVVRIHAQVALYARALDVTHPTNVDVAECETREYRGVLKVK